MLLLYPVLEYCAVGKSSLVTFCKSYERSERLSVGCRITVRLAHERILLAFYARERDAFHSDVTGLMIFFSPPQ